MDESPESMEQLPKREQKWLEDHPATRRAGKGLSSHQVGILTGIELAVYVINNQRVSDDVIPPDHPLYIFETEDLRDAWNEALVRAGDALTVLVKLQEKKWG